MAINLRAEISYKDILLNWDNVYPNYWYVPELKLSDDEFYPLVDIPIKDSEFRYEDYSYNCFRIKVVDNKYKTIAISKGIVCSYEDCESLLPLDSVENDGDCDCLLMMCYQVGCRDTFIVMAEDEFLTQMLDDPPIDNEGNIFRDYCRGKLSWNPIIQDNRVYIKPRDILDFIPGAKVEWDQKNKSLEMYIPRVIYAYGDDTEPVHFTKVELEVGESIALVDNTARKIDKVNNNIKPLIKKDDDGIGHFLIPLRFIAEVAGVRDMIWLPEYNLSIITFDVTDCGCQTEGKNGEDPCTYDDWDILINSILINGEPIDKNIFSIDGNLFDTCVNYFDFINLEFSVVNNNECPIGYVIETPDILPLNIDLRNEKPVRVLPGETSPAIRVEFGVVSSLGEILDAMLFRLVYEDGSYVEKDNTIKVVRAKCCDCCTQMEVTMDWKRERRGNCSYGGEKVNVDFEFGNKCYEPIKIILVPGDRLVEHTFPTDVFDLDSLGDSLFLNVSFTMPEYDGEDSIEWFTIKQVKDGEIIDDCEREFKLWYCEEED